MAVEIDVAAVQTTAADVGAAGRQFGVCEAGGGVPPGLASGLGPVLAELARAEGSLTQRGADRCRALADALERDAGQVVAADTLRG